MTGRLKWFEKHQTPLIILGWGWKEMTLSELFIIMVIVLIKLLIN